MSNSSWRNKKPQNASAGSSRLRKRHTRCGSGKRKHAHRRARAEQEHTSWKEQLDALKQEALEHLWQWPDGMCVSLYHVTYCAGIRRGEDDEPILEREGGWARTDHLDEHGYLGLEPTKPSSWSKTTEPRTIKLSPAIHLPIWERWTVGSVEELPSELREEVIVSLPGMVACRDEDLAAGFRLTRDEGAYIEDDYQECIGRVPLTWIRMLVDQAAASG